MKTLNSWKPGPALAGAILFGALGALPVLGQFDTIISGQSPLDWWKFDETQASPPINMVSNLGSLGAAGTGYLVGTVGLGAPGIGIQASHTLVGTAAIFTNSGQNVGNCTARIDIPNRPELNPEPPFSIEFWAQPTLPYAPVDDETPPTGLAAVSSLTVAGTAGLEGARSGYVFYQSPIGWEFRIGGLASYSATATAALAVSSNWVHIVGTFDGTTLLLYTNGVLADSTPVTGGPFYPNKFAPTRIGGTSLPGDEYSDGNGDGDIGEGNRGYSGSVAEFAVYNTLLSSNTIYEHYVAGSSGSAEYDSLILDSSPVGYWNLEEPAYSYPPTNSYTFAADSGSLLDNGTNTLGTLAAQPGVAGTGDLSVYYNGAAGSLVLDTNVTPPDVYGANLTLAAWINPTSFGYVSDIIAQGYDEKSYAENYFRVGNTYDWEAWDSAPNTPGGYGNLNPLVVPNVAFYEIGSYDGAGDWYQSAVFPAPVGDLGHWVYLVGTCDGTNWNLYRNGKLVNQFSAVFLDGSGTGPAEVNAPWSVGSRSNPNPYFGFFFAGSIAEPMILTNALSAATVSNLYNSVTLPPVITIAPVAPSPAYLGSSALFSTWAEGPGTLTYQWFSNGVAISGQTDTNFSLTGLTAEDSATYSVVVKNANGSVTSAVPLQVTGTLPPIILAPATEVRWLGFPLSFAPANLPNQQFAFQWDFNGTPISGATGSSYSAPTTAGSVGSYTLVLSNSFGVATSSVATFTGYLTAPNTYVSTILADHPLTYFRLDEASGPTAFDYASGDNGTYFGDITLGVPGYSLVDTDTAAFFPGETVPPSYVGNFGSTEINFGGTNSEFSIEAWANGPANQVGPQTTTYGAAVIAKGHGGNGADADEQFAISVTGGGQYVFFVTDSKTDTAAAVAKFGPDGNWHHLVGVCDFQGLGGPAGITLYLDGTNAATASLPGSLVGGVIDSQANVNIGAESSGPGPDFLLAYNGTISQVAIYATNLSSNQVFTHYAARYGPDVAPFIITQPLSVTNYVSLPATLSVSAGGTVPLNYQWSQNGVILPGAIGPTLYFPNLVYSNAGTYTLGITNTISGNIVTGIVSTPVTITVLAPPATPPVIPGLVMHLTFDDTLVDATGRGNNATNEASGGAPLITNDYEPGVIGDAFMYQTTVQTNSNIGTPTTNANYATVGVRPDLKFGTNSFTVSMWVQLPANYLDGNLPFFTDVPAFATGFGFPGFDFSPSIGTGSWGFSVIDNTPAGEGAFGPGSIINGPGPFVTNAWHSLVYVIDRVNGASVYVDGTNSPITVEALSTVVGTGSIDNTNAATIGQDPTGVFPEPSGASTGSFFGIDDLGVWNRALSPLEAASIYMAGVSNHISFSAPPTITLGFSVQPGSKLLLTWSQGNLQGTTNLSGPWTNVVGATSPYTNTPTEGEEYFRLKQ
jgi:Concanavalin A-like lectin/glucanases superfamily